MNGASSVELTQARNSFINAVGLNSPEAKDGLSPEVMEKKLTQIINMQLHYYVSTIVH